MYYFAKNDYVHGLPVDFFNKLVDKIKLPFTSGGVEYSYWPDKGLKVRSRTMRYNETVEVNMVNGVPEMTEFTLPHPSEIYSHPRDHVPLDFFIGAEATTGRFYDMGENTMFLRYSVLKESVTRPHSFKIPNTAMSIYTEEYLPTRSYYIHLDVDEIDSTAFLTAQYRYLSDKNQKSLKPNVDDKIIILTNKSSVPTI